MIGGKSIDRKNMRSIKKRTFHPFPKPWKSRIEKYANFVDEIQRSLEISIGWTKKYDRQFLVEVDMNDEEIGMVISMLKFLNPDLKKIYVKKSKDSFGDVIRARFCGETPKLKKIRLSAEKKVAARGGKIRVRMAHPKGRAFHVGGSE